jgi:hypothetical protein
MTPGQEIEYHLPWFIQFNLDKRMLLWLVKHLINLRGLSHEKEPDKFQQHKAEENPRVSRQNGHQRRAKCIEQETGKG